MLDPQDTIAAIASPAGPAHRGLVRVTGPRAFEIVLAGFAPEGPLEREMPRRPQVIAGCVSLEGLAAPLSAHLFLWPSHRALTGQNLAEVHTVGTPPLLQALLASFLHREARLAEPGEFTLRGFLAGRLDLTQAEAVLGVIDARSSNQLHVALAQMAGGLSSVIQQVRDRLLNVLAHLEAGLDFVDEADVDPLQQAALIEQLRRGLDEITELSARLDRRDRPEGRPRVVLMGPPNAGKSRLFNALTRTPGAIVSPIAGTTRDYLVSTCDCDGLIVDLIDTAGATPAEEAVEELAQQHRLNQTAQADLVLVCTPADHEVAEVALGDVPSLHVTTKCDLAVPTPGLLATSAATGQGLEVLRRAIAERLGASPEDGAAVAATSGRCRGSLTNAQKYLRDAIDTLELGHGDEFVTIDLRAALDELGQVVGAVVTEDVLDRIFSRFCIGK